MNLLRLKVVLAAIDHDEASVAVLRAAHALAQAAGAELHVVHVAPIRSTSTTPRKAERTTSSGERVGELDATRAVIARAGLDIDTLSLHVLDGDARDAIRSTADGVGADVIVLGPHRSRDDTGNVALGSTALAVATNSWAPCLVVSDPIRMPLARVLVPVDLSDTARGALMVGLTWASALRGSSRGAGASAGAGPDVILTALLVDTASTPGHITDHRRRALEDELEYVRERGGTWSGVTIQSAVLERPDVAKAIADFARAERADLVVLGTRGLGLDATGRLGSVSLAVAKELALPILLVPPAVWGEYAKTA